MAAEELVGVIHRVEHKGEESGSGDSKFTLAQFETLIEHVAGLSALSGTGMTHETCYTNYVGCHQRIWPCLNKSLVFGMLWSPPDQLTDRWKAVKMPCCLLPFDQITY